MQVRKPQACAFLISKCKSYLCNNPRPKPIAAPENECLLLCLPLCTVSIQNPSALHLLLHALCCFPTTLGITSERSPHTTRYSTAICSRFGMDSCPISPHLQSRHLGPPWLFPAEAGFPRVTFTWKLWSKHLGHSLSYASKMKELESFEALENALNFWRRNPTSIYLLCVWHDPELRKPSWVEVAGLISPHHLPLRRVSLGLEYVLLLLLKQPQLRLPLRWPLSRWVTALHIPAPYTSAGRLHEAKESMACSAALPGGDTQAAPCCRVRNWLLKGTISMLQPALPLTQSNANQLGQCQFPN